MKKKSLIFVCVFTLISLSFSGCNKKSEKDGKATKAAKVEKSAKAAKSAKSGKYDKSEKTSGQIQTVKVKPEFHNWYYFTKDSLKEIEKPQNAPAHPMIPWTETIRISSSNVGPENADGQIKGYAIVNRLGVLYFNDDEFTLSPDVSLFTDRTCGNLVFINETPVFSVYKSAFFNDTITDPLYKEKNTQHLFLVQYDDVAKISYPIVNCNNLTEEPNSEVTECLWDGQNWYCSVKTITDVKNIFSYLVWKPSESLLSISPNNAKDKIVIQEIDVDTFRNAYELKEFATAPERIRKMLASFSSTVPFGLELKTAGGCSPDMFVNAPENTTAKALNAKGIITKSWSSVLFEDGTLFLEGALPGKHILRGGKAVAIRLPKLPADFVYTDFIISGTTLYAAWEETSFYKTARSGILKVNLEKSLYSKLL